MSKLATFVMLSIAISALLYLSGVTSDSETNTINIIKQMTKGNVTETSLETSPDVNDIKQSKLYVWVLAAIGISLVGLFASLLTGNSGAARMSGAIALSAFLINFISDMLYVIAKAGSSCEIGMFCTQWTYWLLWVIFVTIAGGFIMALADFIYNNE